MDSIAHAAEQMHDNETRPHMQVVSEDRLHTIGYNYLGILHTITYSSIYVDLNKIPKGFELQI